jgi:hypothetical protein
MHTHFSFWDSKGRWFRLRLALAYLIVPLTAPTILVLQIMRAPSHPPFSELTFIIELYAVFSFAAMVVLGVPLLFLYARLRWSGFSAFIAGGAACAAATYTLMMWGRVQWDQFVLYTMFGVVEGLVFRMILFGIALRPRYVAPLSE